MSHRAFACRSTRSEDRIHQRAERTHSVAAGMAGPPDNEDLNRAQLPDVDAQIEVPKEFTDRGLKIGLELLVLHSGHADCAYARDVHVAIAIDDRAIIDVDRAPGADQELVARSNYVVRGNRHAVDGREGRWDLRKERLSKDWQLLADGLGNKILEFIFLRRFNWAWTKSLIQ